MCVPGVQILEPKGYPAAYLMAMACEGSVTYADRGTLCNADNGACAPCLDSRGGRSV